MRRGGLILLLLMCALTAAPAGQESMPSVPSLINRNRRGVVDTSVDVDPALSSRRLRALNAARQKELVSDAEKLLRLARQLSLEAQARDAGPTAVQSAKIGEIEKLAHRVKEKMIESVADVPSLRPPPSPFDR